METTPQNPGPKLLLDLQTTRVFYLQNDGLRPLIYSEQAGLKKERGWGKRGREREHANLI